MAEYKVDCIDKPNRLSPHEHITSIGGMTVSGRWSLKVEDVIYQITNRINSFYTIDGFTGRKMYVGVVAPIGRRPYIRTYADGKWNDNLLSLNQCTLVR